MGYGSRKSHHLLSARRPGRAGGVIQPQSAGLRSRRYNVRGRRGWLSRLKKRERGDWLSFPCLFYPVPWRMEGAHPNEEGGPLHSVTESNANLPESCLPSHPDVMLSRLRGHPLAQSG